MNDPVTIITTGRVTADLELKTSQNGKNTKYVQFSLAVNKGYGDNEHPNFYSCVAYEELAQRLINAKVKRGSRIRVIADQDLVEYDKRSGGTGWMAKLTLLDWSYELSGRPKDNDSNGLPPSDDESGFNGTENCGPNGLPFP